MDPYTLVSASHHHHPFHCSTAASLIHARMSVQVLVSLEEFVRQALEMRLHMTQIYAPGLST